MVSWRLAGRLGRIGDQQVDEVRKATSAITNGFLGPVFFAFIGLTFVAWSLTDYGLVAAILATAIVAVALLLLVLLAEAAGNTEFFDKYFSLLYQVNLVVGLGLVLTTGWLPFDPICGLLMAGNILISGGGLMKSAFAGLMDFADPAVQQSLTRILDRETAQRGISYHQLRHRNVGDAHWVEVHLLFPEGTMLGDAHRTATEIERVIEGSLEPSAQVSTHLECQSDHQALHPHELEGAQDPGAKPPPAR